MSPRRTQLAPSKPTQNAAIHTRVHGLPLGYRYTITGSEPQNVVVVFDMRAASVTLCNDLRPSKYQRLSSSTRRGIGLLLALGFLLLATAGRGQDFNRYGPRQVPDSRRESQLPEGPKEASGDTRILVDHLRAMVFVDAPPAPVLWARSLAYRASISRMRNKDRPKTTCGPARTLLPADACA